MPPENATVVVGTVIDPEMTEEIKVTVVATGLGEAKEQDIRVVNQQNTAAVAQGARRAAAATSDYGQLELPTVMRNRNDGVRAKDNPVVEPEVQETQKTGTDDMEFLDIPAFLRRQAD